MSLLNKKFEKDFNRFVQTKKHPEKDLTVGEKAITFLTGKNKTQRLQQSTAEKNIRNRELAAYYKAKEKERILYAQQRATIERQQALEKFKAKTKPQNYSMPVGGGLSGIWGMPTTNKKSNQSAGYFDVLSGRTVYPKANTTHRRKTRRRRMPHRRKRIRYVEYY